MATSPSLSEKQYSTCLMQPPALVAAVTEVLNCNVFHLCTAALDISADLSELGRTPVAVVCAGVKSILDIGRTLEVLVSVCGEIMYATEYTLIDHSLVTQSYNTVYNYCIV